jgi:hypothetical protein
VAGPPSSARAVSDSCSSTPRSTPRSSPVSLPALTGNIPSTMDSIVARSSSGSDPDSSAGAIVHGTPRGTAVASVRSSHSPASTSRTFHLTLPIGPSIPSVCPTTASATRHSTSSFVTHLHRSLSTVAMQHFMPIAHVDADADAPHTDEEQAHQLHATQQRNPPSSEPADSLLVDAAYHPLVLDAHATGRFHRHRPKDRPQPADGMMCIGGDGAHGGLEVSLRDNVLGDACIGHLMQSIHTSS